VQRRWGDETMEHRDAPQGHGLDGGYDAGSSTVDANWSASPPTASACGRRRAGREPIFRFHPI
jgi:hypothetical protein